MHHVILDSWTRRLSPLHRLDPRAKAIALLAFLIALATTPGAASVRIVAYAAVALGAVLIARLPLGRVLLRAAAVLPFAIVFALLCWFGGDHARASALLEKTYISALAVLVVAGSTPLPALLEGFANLGAPRMLVSVIQFLYRYLFVVSEQAQHMRIAASCRAGIPHRSRLHRFRAAAGALGVLFARSYLRALGIHRAMLARGYNGRLPVAAATQFKPSDAVFAAAAVALLAAIRIAPY